MSARTGLGPLIAACLALLLLGSAFARPAGAQPLPPKDLRVVGGEDNWRVSDRFELRWTPVHGIIAATYRVLRADGSLAVGPIRVQDPNGSIYPVRAPAPGEYTAEVWLEDSAGANGASSSVTLRFDDVRPGMSTPAPLPAWIGRAGLPSPIRLLPPPTPHPPSGIRGYAVSVGPTSDGEPCADPLVCADSETDLRGGVEDDIHWVDELPEGTSHLSVVAVSGSGVRSETAGRAVLRVDKTNPVTRLDGAPTGWVDGPVHLVATATDHDSGMVDRGMTAVQPFTAIRVNGGVPKVAVGDAVSASVFAEGVHTVEHYARDAAGNAADGGRVNGHQNRMPAAELIRIDRTPPTVQFLPAQDPRDPERIEARIVDALSGASTTRGGIGVRPAGSGDQFEALPTVNQGGLLSARWSSDDYPLGVYEFGATGYDAAGNAAFATERIGGTSMVLANPLKVPTVLRAGFGQRRSARQRCPQRSRRHRCHRNETLRFSRRLRREVFRGGATLFGGRLGTGTTAAIGGQPVEVIERFGEGNEPLERVTTVTTDAAGRFTLRLPVGPSREIAARFRGSPTLTRSASPPVRLAVRGDVRLRVSSATAAVGGRPVVFSGIVRALRGEIPSEGKAVALQFRLPDIGWTEFRTLRSDRRGRFRHAYRFADDDSRGVRFRFRAVATAEPGWPYEPGSSRPVVVRGK